MANVMVSFNPTMISVKQNKTNGRSTKKKPETESQITEYINTHTHANKNAPLTSLIQFASYKILNYPILPTCLVLSKMYVQPKVKDESSLLILLLFRIV